MDYKMVYNSQQYEAQYKELVRKIIGANLERQTRTGSTLAVFNQSIQVPLWYGFPMLTGRKINFKLILQEAQWFLSGSNQVKDLGNSMWDQWADKDGFIHPGYSEIGRQYPHVVDLLLKQPTSRRACIDLARWNTGVTEPEWLEPCYHTLQFYIVDGFINLTVSSRSSDVAVGLPHDIPVLAFIQTRMAHDLILKSGLLTFNICDAHINIENLEAVKEYLAQPIAQLPILYKDKDGWGVEGYPNNVKQIKMVVKP